MTFAKKKAISEKLDVTASKLETDWKMDEWVSMA
jgi:hypothetical protein